MIAAVMYQGMLRFRFFDGGMDANVLIEFMRRLVEDARRKMILIPGNVQVHHARVVKTRLEKHTKQIEVSCLPACSPELNPDDYLNCDMNAGVCCGKPARSKERIRRRATI